MSPLMGSRGSASNEQDGNGELIVELETETVAASASNLQRAADALANELCTDSLVHWASVGASSAKSVLYISYGVAQNIESTDDATGHAKRAYQKLHERGDFPTMSLASVSVRVREAAPAHHEDDDEPAVRVVGTLIKPAQASEPHLSKIEQDARTLVKTLRAVGERTDADSIDRCLRGGAMSLERLRALRQQLILLRGSHTPYLLGDDRQVENLVRQTNLAVARFPGTKNDLLAGPEFRRRMQAPAKIRAGR